MKTIHSIYEFLIHWEKKQFSKFFIFIYFSLILFLSFRFYFFSGFIIPIPYLRILLGIIIILSLLVGKESWLILFSSIFVFYLSFTNPVPSSDLIPARVLPFWFENKLDFIELSSIEDTGLKFVSKDELQNVKRQIEFLPHQVGEKYLLLPYFLVKGKTEILPSYPWTPGFFSYFIYKFAGIFYPASLVSAKLDQTSLLILLPQIYRLEKVTSSLIATLTSFFLFLILQKKPFEKGSKTSLVLVLMYSFATSHFSTSSQGLWQHTIVEFFLSLSLLVLFLNQKTKRSYVLLGLCLAFLFYSRPSSIFLFLFPGYWMIVTLVNDKKLSPLGLTASSFLVFTFSFFALNDAFYGDFLGGYSLLKRSLFLMGHSNLFNYPFWKGLVGLLFSPGFGYFLFSPILLIPFFLFKRSENKLLFLVLILPIVSTVVFFSFYIFWQGGHSFGARFLTDINIYSVLLFALLPKDLWRSKIFLIFFILTFVFSFYIQYYGSNQKEKVSMWNSCFYEDSFSKAMDWKNLPFRPNLDQIGCRINQQ